VPKPLRLGLTGGIGSGKSTAAALLGDWGAVVIDADAIARLLTAPNGLAITPISQTFGADFISADGAMDRLRMRQLVFSDPSAKIRLESIIHPLVKAESNALTDAAAKSGCACLVFDVPLLVESKSWRQQLDRVLVIDCTTQTQIERVQLRSALSRDSIQAIIASQATRQQRLQAADIVIFNEHLSISELKRQLQSLRALFGLSLRHNSDSEA
jgi:dephospho-CoA kinase